MSKKKSLIGILRLNQVEITSRGIQEDSDETFPLVAVHGNHNRLWQLRGSWIWHLAIIKEGGRDYYMFSLHHNNVDYLLAPGDYVMVYDDGSVQALIGLSDDDVARIYSLFTTADI